jgi:hypothetical protein
VKQSGREGRGVEGLKQRLFSSTPVLRLQFSGQSPTRVCCRSWCFCIAPSNNKVLSGSIHTIPIRIPYQYTRRAFSRPSTPSSSASDPDPQVTQRPSARPNQASASVSAAIAIAMEMAGRGVHQALLYCFALGLLRQPY